MLKPEFIDHKIENEFSTNGFIHSPNFLNETELSQLRTFFEESYNYNGEKQGMWNSLYNLPKKTSIEISQKILTVLTPKLREIFKNFSCPIASFMVKNPNRNGITDLHRDYSSQDESRFQYRNIWIPLIDISVDNGALYTLKYSHTFFDYPLPMFGKWPYLKYQQILFKSSDIIEAKAGDLVVYADRTLHGSFINQTNYPRPVVHFGLLHPSYELYFYHMKDDSSIVSMYNVPFEFFFENNFGNQDGRFPVFKRFEYNPPKYSLEEILHGLKLL